MSRRSARPLTANKKEVGAENVAPNKAETEEKKGFFSRIFGKKNKDAEVKQTAAKVKRVRRKSKLAEEEIFNDVDALKEEIKEVETNVNKLETQKDQPLPPTSLLPPPPPPPPPPPAVKKAEKIQKVVGKTNVPSDNQAIDVHFEMMNAIRNGAKNKLRKTSIRRSLGGTPIREKREYAPCTDAEIFAASVIIRDDSSSDEDSSDNEML